MGEGRGHSRWVESSLGGVKQQSQDLVGGQEEGSKVGPHFSDRPGRWSWLCPGLGNPEGALWRGVVEMGLQTY